jgi:hypothetical protein
MPKRTTKTTQPETPPAPAETILEVLARTSDRETRRRDLRTRRDDLENQLDQIGDDIEELDRLDLADRRAIAAALIRSGMKAGETRVLDLPDGRTYLVELKGVRGFESGNFTEATLRAIERLAPEAL